jgi:cellulose biosynthesis protein BcsQ
MSERPGDARSAPIAACDLETSAMASGSTLGTEEAMAQRKAAAQEQDTSEPDVFEGVGKSTLAVHLAAWLHEQGHRVILADCDMQHSSSEWLREAAPEVQTVRLASPDQILDELPQIAREADYVVADGPGSNTETSRALRLRADLALVPCKASMLEVKALAQATSVLRQAHEIRRGAPRAVIVLSMVGKTYPADAGHEGRELAPRKEAVYSSLRLLTSSPESRCSR